MTWDGGYPNCKTRTVSEHDCCRLWAKQVRFFQYVQPAYPVLCAQDYKALTTGLGSDLSIGLKAAIYALALPFCFLDDHLSLNKAYQQPPTDGLWGIAHRCLVRSSQKPLLALVQLYCLLLQRPPENFAVGDMSGQWTLSCSALAAAESLGLNLDPSDWRLPRWEMHLRRRLWWIVYIDHIWSALVLGRPSHVKDENWSVSKLTLEDLEVDEHGSSEVGNHIRGQSAYFLSLCDLTGIASDVLSRL